MLKHRDARKLVRTRAPRYDTWPELAGEATIRKFRIVRTEGARQVTRDLAQAVATDATRLPDAACGSTARFVCR